MKRTATTLALLAGIGGGCTSPDGGQKAPQQGGFGTVTRPMTAPGYQGPAGEPVPLTSARGATPGGVQQASMSRTMTEAVGVQPAGGSRASRSTVGVIPGAYRGSAADGGIQRVNFQHGGGDPRLPGILPVPGMGPPGAVAAVGAMVPGMQPPAANMRSSVRFLGPKDMKVTWQLPGGKFSEETSGLSVGQPYNFLQGQVYRLKLTKILPDFQGRRFYPTLEVSPATPKTVTFLSHATIPVGFTLEDFQQADAGNLVVKVIYLPDPINQDFAIVPAAEEIVSTRLEPGADPVAEAQRRGTILAVIRLGNIELENPASPAINEVPGPGGFGPPPNLIVPLPGPGAGVPPGPGGPGGPSGAATSPRPLPPTTPALPPVVTPGPTNPAVIAPIPPAPPSRPATPNTTVTPPTPSSPVAPVPPTAPGSRPTTTAPPLAPGPLPPAVSTPGTTTPPRPLPVPVQPK